MFMCYFKNNIIFCLDGIYEKAVKYNLKSNSFSLKMVLLKNQVKSILSTK